MYLAPESYQVAKGESFSLFIDREDKTKIKNDDNQTENKTVKYEHTLWPMEYLDWFYIRAGGTQINKASIKPTDDENIEYAVSIASTGSAMIGLDSKARIEKIASADFETFLTKKIASSTLPVGKLPMPEDRDVLVRRIESAKTLVTVGIEPNTISHSAVVLSKSGQVAEIRPIVDPTSVTPGSELIFRVYINAPAGYGVKVLVTHIDSGKISEILTDSARICNFKALDSGVYYLEAHAAKPLKTFKEMNKKNVDNLNQSNQPDWELVSTSISFKINRPKDYSQ